MIALFIRQAIWQSTRANCNILGFIIGLTAISSATANTTVQSNITQDSQPLFNQCTSDPLLTDILASDDAKKLQLLYSDRIINSEMRAIGEASGTYAQQLSTWLSLYGLTMVTTPSGNHLITRSTTPLFIAGKVFTEDGQAITHTEITIAGIKQHIATSASGCFYIFTQTDIQSLEQNIKIKGIETPVSISAQNNWWNIQVNKPSSPPLEDIIVVGSSHQIMHKQLSTNNSFGREQIERLPHLGDDITRAFRRLPGAASGDISPKINVRGGEKNELVMVLDNLDLHKPWYFKSLDGLVSVIDSNIIASADVLSGGYTAEYGDKSSAIIDIKTLSTDEIRPRVGLSFLTAFAQHNMPFNNNRGGIYGSLRGGYLDLAFNLAGAEADIEPRYNDLFVKTEYELNENNIVNLNILLAKDKLLWDNTVNGIREYIDDDSSNNNIWINLHSDIGEFIQANNTLSMTDVDQTMLAYYDEPNVIWQDQRDYQALGFKSDWIVTLNSQHLFKGGLNVKKLTTDYDYFLAVYVAHYHHNPFNFTSMFREEKLSLEGQDRSTYLAWRFKAMENLVTELGGRWSEQTYNALNEERLFSPRFNLVYDFSEKNQVNFSWGEFRQAQEIDELSPGDNDMEFHKSQLAEHTIIGLHHQANDNINFRVDIYQKKYHQLIPRYENLYKDIERIVNEATDDRIRIAPESAEARGIELGINYNSQQYFSAWTNYTYSKVNDFINGHEIPRSWDQRHAVNFGLDWKFTEWHFNISGMIRSGWPTTPSVIDPRKPRNLDATKPDFENYNSERLDGYSRLDVRITKKRTLSNGSVFQYYVEIYNLLDSDNPCCTKYQAEFSETDTNGRTIPKFDNWLPRLPSFGVQYIF